MDSNRKIFSNGVEAPDRSREIPGALSGVPLRVPDVRSGYPAATVVDVHGSAAEPFDRGRGFPDACSHRLKIGLLIPATNCTAEFEMWSVIGRNPDVLDGVGIHATPIRTPTPSFGDAEELAQYRRDFDANLLDAVDVALLAEPESMVLGFSMEHFSPSVAEGEVQPALVRERADGISLATWRAAAQAALDAYEARRIAILCPFDPTGLANAVGYFEELGREVVSAVGLGCATGVDVGHVPDDLKERVIRERLLAHGPVDAILQCGTNLSSLALAERLEGELGLPLIGINVALLWFTLRELGIDSRLHGGSRLLRDH